MTDHEDELDEVVQPDEAFGIEAFRRDVTLSPPQFASLHGQAFLLLHRADSTKSSDAPRLQAPARPSRTLISQPAAIVRRELQPSRYLVFPVRKTERSLIGRFYSIGQTRNNDIVIRDVSISKSHAFFQNDAAGVFLLQDARSTNGSFVNGTRVPQQGKGAPVKVSSGDQLRFGNIELRFLDADAFRQLVITHTKP